MNSEVSKWLQIIMPHLVQSIKSDGPCPLAAGLHYDEGMPAFSQPLQLSQRTDPFLSTKKISSLQSLECRFWYVRSLLPWLNEKRFFKLIFSLRSIYSVFKVLHRSLLGQIEAERKRCSCKVPQ